MYASYFCSMSRGNQDAYDTNKMAEEFTHLFFDQALSVGQQVFKCICQRLLLILILLYLGQILDYSVRNLVYLVLIRNLKYEMTVRVILTQVLL